MDRTALVSGGKGDVAELVNAPSVSRLYVRRGLSVGPRCLLGRFAAASILVGSAALGGCSGAAPGRAAGSSEPGVDTARDTVTSRELGNSDAGRSDGSGESIAYSLSSGYSGSSGRTGAGLEAGKEYSADEATARVLSEPTSSELGLRLARGVGFTQLTVDPSLMPGSGQLRYEVSRLESPPRLVIDLYGVPNRFSRNYDTAEGAEISRVRIGTHPEKSRIVLDLPVSDPVNHRVAKLNVPGSKKPEIQITVARISSASDITADRAGADRAGLDGASYVANSASTELADPEFARDSSAERAPELAASTEITNGKKTGDSKPQLEDSARSERDIRADSTARAGGARAEGSESAVRVVALALDQVGPDQNMLTAELTENAPFSLKRTAPSEYVLTIKGVEVEPSAAPTLISPVGSGEIRTVRSVAQGEDVLFRIFTTPKATLSAKAANHKILVTTSNETNDRAFSDMRAQADTAKVGKETVSKDTVKTEVIKSPGKSGNAEVKVSDAAKVNEKTEKNSDSNKETTTSAAPSEDLDVGVAALLGEQPKYTGRLISLDLQDTDIDNALRIIAEVSNLNIIASDDVTGKVTLRLIDVPWDQALDVILKTNGLDKVQEGNVVRIAPVEKLRLEREALKQAQQAEEELEPLAVRYIRISYAKSSQLRTLVESVLSERGSVAYDERTNQLIVKDIRKGLKNVVELVSKLDLRTPQILLETQIVEANRSLLRSLGATLGFNYVQSPATGNATGWNFPNSVTTNGNVAFPGATDPLKGGSTISFLLESADSTKSLSAALTALEDEGRVRIVSRPAVATTNNTPAQIKSVEKIRIKTPSGGLSVATGQGASASGSSSTATESVEIGIVLDVTPQASPDYYVLLDIKAKSSAFGSHTVDGIPSEIERAANSSVLVSSGQTFAMGGIYRVIDKDSLTGVPFLKDIPVLGHFFRVSSTDTSDEELIFFVTPRIIEGSFDDAAMKVSL